MQVRESTLTLKPRADITRSPKHGYKWPHKRTDVLQFFLKKSITGKLLENVNYLNEVFVTDSFSVHVTGNAVQIFNILCQIPTQFPERFRLSL